MSGSLPEPPVNGSTSHGERQSSASSLPPAAQLCVRPSARCEDAAPAVCAGLRCSGAAAQSALLQAPWGTAPPSPAGPQQPGAPLGSGSCAGPVPTFQPVFFTGAFPLNMQGNGKSVSPRLSLGFVTLDGASGGVCFTFIQCSWRCPGSCASGIGELFGGNKKGSAVLARTAIKISMQTFAVCLKCYKSTEKAG